MARILVEAFYLIGTINSNNDNISNSNEITTTIIMKTTYPYYRMDYTHTGFLSSEYFI